MKKRLTNDQEFQIMKLVLDKFLWIGFILIGVGMYMMYTTGIAIGLAWTAAGVIILILFMMLLIREYEIGK